MPIPPSSLLVVLLPVIWLAVAAIVVTACRMAARGDGRRYIDAEPKR
jgi:hypothetical protein